MIIVGKGVHRPLGFINYRILYIKSRLTYKNLITYIFDIWNTL